MGYKMFKAKAANVREAVRLVQEGNAEDFAYPMRGDSKGLEELA